MTRTLLIALAAAMAAPTAFAVPTSYDTPAPFPLCQATYINPSDGFYHHYLPPVTGNAVIGGDGNLQGSPPCPKPSPVEVGLGLCFDATSNTPIVCDPYNTGVPTPLAQYDGELDYGHGGAFLFVRSGDGSTEGTIACFGWPSVGHHPNGGPIFAEEWLPRYGPQFTVTSDYSRAGLEEDPDCGDNYVEPCDPNKPVPSTQPFPLNVVIDTINGLLYTIFGPSGPGCNPLDNAQRFPSTPVGPSGGAVGFGAGADGAYVVFIEPDTNTGRIPVAGHVWS